MNYENIKSFLIEKVLGKPYQELGNMLKKAGAIEKLLGGLRFLEKVKTVSLEKTPNFTGLVLKLGRQTLLPQLVEFLKHFEYSSRRLS